MKTIIHDLGESYEALLKDKCDHIICADGRYAPCQGCFGCWTKHPVQCHMKDSLQMVSRTLGRTKNLVIITENCYGAYSPAVKTILDRGIGISTPFSTYRGKQMHHILRYGNHEKLTVYTYGDMTEEEENTFRYMVERTSINNGFREFEFHVLSTLDELEGVAL